jgi:hypothetical protein
MNKIMKNHCQSFHMKVQYLTATIVAIVLCVTSHAQMPAAITITPEDATAEDTLTLTLNPSLACFQSGSLVGAPIIYMHSGVTYNGDTWQNVIPYNGIGHDGTPTSLTPNGDGTYSITYCPLTFYAFPPGSVVTQICAVFNGGDWNHDARDFNPDIPPECMDFFIPLAYSGEASIDFNVNMNKMINDGMFDPFTQSVYVVIQGLTPTDYGLLDLDGDGIYSCIVQEGLMIGVTYNYQFRIDEDQYETVQRTLTTIPGTLNVNVWWNDEILGTVTLTVDMSYQIALGNFDPYNDFVDMAGNMNWWLGSGPMTDMGAGQYSTTFFYDEGLFEYKFRINGDWATSEFPNGGPNRMAWCQGSILSLFHYYDDYNPDRWPATFEVDMNVEIEAGNFDPDSDYLDVAGTMNGWLGNDFLFDRTWPSENIYTSTLLIDKNYPSLEFKFRINGNWNTSEFPNGGPNRTWTVQDTAGGFINLYPCVYNVPNASAPPSASDLYIEGDLWSGSTVTGMYSYYDPNEDPEGTSLYQWYRAFVPDMSQAEVIEGATNQSYVIALDDVDHYLAFEVTPVSATGNPSTGEPAHVFTDQIITIGIEDKGSVHPGDVLIKVYPNPADGFMIMSATSEYKDVVIMDLTGRVVINVGYLHAGENKVNLNGLVKGMYIVSALNETGESFKTRIIKD